MEKNNKERQTDRKSLLEWLKWPCDFPRCFPLHQSLAELSVVGAAGSLHDATMVAGTNAAGLLTAVVSAGGFLLSRR